MDHNKQYCPPDVVRRGESWVDFYFALLGEGMEPRFAEMLACQSAPGAKNENDSFMRGRGNNQDLDSMPREVRDLMITEAKQNGVDVRGKVYVSGLAKRAMDPAAWVSDSSELKHKATKQGKAVTGAVNT